MGRRLAMRHRTRAEHHMGQASREGPGWPALPWLSPRLAVAVTVAVLVVVNVVDVRVPHASLVVGPVCAAALLGLARLAGLGWPQLGRGPGEWGGGAPRRCSG